MRGLLVVTCLWAWWGSAQLAFAQATSVVLLPTRGDERMAAQRDVAQQALAEALTAQGFAVTSHADAISRLPDRATACGAVDCAPNMLRALSMSLAAACAVWLSPDAPEGTVFVTLVDDAGGRYPGARTVNGGELAIATRAALADARALQLLGPGPWVRVHGKPEGASVSIDGHVVGMLPYRAAMTAGRYQLRVHAPGYVSDRQNLDIPLNSGREVDIGVDLVAGDDPPEPVLSTERSTEGVVASPAVRPSEAESGARVAQTGDYLLGGSIALGGLLLMTIDPIWTLMKEGDCVDARCRQIYGFSTRSTLEVLGGAALVGIGAVVTFVIQPFAVQVQTGEQSTLVLKASF